MQRTQPAERLYRLTGGGIYRDSLIVGASVPGLDYLSSSVVLGQDSLMAVPYKNHVYWFFGDTECPQGPRSTDCQHYGRFTTGATTPYPPIQSGILHPSPTYFTSTNSSDPGGMDPNGTPNGTLLTSWNPFSFSHPRAMLVPSSSLQNLSTWIGSLTSLTIQNESRMYTTYVQPTGGPDKLYGLARYDDASNAFRPIPSPESRSFRYSGAQVVQKLSPSDANENYVYYASAFATERIRASSFESFEDPASVEYFTPCSSENQGGCMNTSGGWGWKNSNLASDGDTNPNGHAAFGPTEEAKTIVAGLLDQKDARMQVIDSTTGKPIGGIISRGSVNWNARRNKYVLIGDRQDNDPVQSSSRYGQIYYCEADTIVGPWRECVLIATHNKTGTSCYNPLQLPWLDELDGQVIYFACTFTSMASGGNGHADPVCRFDQYGGIGCSVAVPRYEYNNIVFRLDLENLYSR